MELEIKLVALPGAHLDDEVVLSAAATLGPLHRGPTRRLRAAYHGGPDGLLRQRRHTLRCRDEDGRIVATVKGPGPLVRGVRGRIEVETEVPGMATPGSPLPAPLADTLRSAGLPIEEWPEIDFVTDIRRTTAHVRLPDAEAELAIDRGEVTAGGRSSPVLELELELIDGDPAALVAACGQLAQRLSVRPGNRSKAARGFHLLGRLADPVLPSTDAPLPELWEAFIALEELRRDGDDRLAEHHRALQLALGIAGAPDDPQWTSRLWGAFARASEPR